MCDVKLPIRAGILELYGVDEVATVAHELVAGGPRPATRGPSPWPAPVAGGPVAGDPWPVPVARDPWPIAGDPCPSPHALTSVPIDRSVVGFLAARREPVRRPENGTSHGLRHGGA
jgi:hypothetical protein